MSELTSVGIAQSIQKQNREQFSYYQIDEIQINEANVEPQLIINVHHKLNHRTAHLTLTAERQDNNTHNVHWTLINNDDLFTQMYQHHRGDYVNANHQLAKQIATAHIVPDNLYLIQDASGCPGIDFIHLNQFKDALNSLLVVSALFTIELTTKQN